MMQASAVHLLSFIALWGGAEHGAEHKGACSLSQVRTMLVLFCYPEHPGCLPVGRATCWGRDAGAWLRADDPAGRFARGVSRLSTRLSPCPLRQTSHRPTAGLRSCLVQRAYAPAAPAELLGAAAATWLAVGGGAMRAGI